MTIRVLIADDQDIVRAGLTMILEAQPDIDVVGEAADGREAVALARSLRPDVCLFDIRMPGLDVIEATRQLAGRDVDDPLAVVVITTFDLEGRAPMAGPRTTLPPPSSGAVDPAEGQDDRHGEGPCHRRDGRAQPACAGARSASPSPWLASDRA